MCYATKAGLMIIAAAVYLLAQGHKVYGCYLHYAMSSGIAPTIGIISTCLLAISSCSIMLHLVCIAAFINQCQLCGLQSIM